MARSLRAHGHAKYIFPGGHIPALSEAAPVVEHAGPGLTDLEILRLHYADTPMSLARAHYAESTTGRRIYNQRFKRMWEFYLASQRVGIPLPV